MESPKITVRTPDLESPTIYSTVEFWEERDSFQARIEVGVWVANSDSRTELHRRTLEAAIDVMRKALASHS